MAASVVVVSVVSPYLQYVIACGGKHKNTVYTGRRFTVVSVRRLKDTKKRPSKWRNALLVGGSRIGLRTRGCRGSSNSKGVVESHEFASEGILLCLLRHNRMRY